MFIWGRNGSSVYSLVWFFKTKMWMRELSALYVRKNVQVNWTRPSFFVNIALLVYKIHPLIASCVHLSIRVGLLDHGNTLRFVHFFPFFTCKKYGIKTLVLSSDMNTSKEKIAEYIIS